MVEAKLCPVCWGRGKKLKSEEELRLDRNSFDPLNKNSYKTCHGCFGRGWVEIGK